MRSRGPHPDPVSTCLQMARPPENQLPLFPNTPAASGIAASLLDGPAAPV